MKLIDKSALVAEIERRLDELYDLLPDASKVENGSITTSEACNTGKYTALESFRRFLDTLEVKEINNVWHDARRTIPEDGSEQIICIKEDGLATATEGRIVSGTTKWAYLSDLLNLDNSCNFEKNLQEEPVSDINIEQELYKAFGQVKDFTLGMQIAKRFYEMGKNNQEHVSEDLGEYINELSKQFPEVSFAKLSRIAVRVAKWQKKQMMAKAFDGEILENYDGKVIKYDDTILDEKLSDCKVFDKVKIIVIKEG